MCQFFNKNIFFSIFIIYSSVVLNASAVFEVHTIATLTKNLQHLILIGDHEQLSPIPNDQSLIQKGLDISLFERLIKNQIPFKILTQQFRMRPCISSLITPYIYKNLENHPSVYIYDNIRGNILHLI